MSRDFQKGLATRLFATEGAYDVLSGGRGFILTVPNPEPPESPLHLIVNWFEELRAKVGT